MKLDRLTITVLAFATAVSVVARAASAQSSSATSATTSSHLKQLAAGYFLGSFPSGDWGKIAGFGLGLDGTDVIQRRAGSPFAIRTSTGLLYNFSRTVDVPSSNLGPNDKLTIETKNWSIQFGIGPEWSARNKEVTPFIYGTAGFDTYWTSSELAGTAAGLPYSAAHGDSRLAFAWAAGLGLRRQVTAGKSVELSAEYRSGLTHEFLRPEDVSVSGGGVVANRSSHTSDQILVRLGTVLGF
jgi:hypothetical protein